MLKLERFSTLLFTIAIVLLSTARSAEAVTRIALVSSDEGAAIENVLLLAEVQLSKSPEIYLLERMQIREVLSEHKLMMAGFVDPEQVIQVGKLLSVDLFAIVESDQDKKVAMGLVVFDSRSGVRLWDAALLSNGLDESVATIEQSVRAAVAKFQSPADQLRTVGVLTVRNADLPLSFDSTVQAMARLLERELVQSPGVAIVERERLRHVLAERRLLSEGPLPPLLASMQLVELEFGRAVDGEAFLATSRISDSAGRTLASPSFSAGDPLAVITGLLPPMLEAMNVKPEAVKLDRVQEAKRFDFESSLSANHKQYERALWAAEAALALDPSQTHRYGTLIMRSSEAAIELVDPGQQQRATAVKVPVNLSDLQRSIGIARRGLDVLDDLLHKKMTTPEWPKTFFDSGFNYYFSYMPKITALTERETPGAHELVHDFVREYQRIVVDELGDNLHQTAVSGRGIREYTSWLSSIALLNVLINFPPVCEDWSELTEKLVTRWAEIADKHHPVQDAELMRSCDYVLMSVRWMHRRSLTEIDRERLRRTFVSLGSRHDPVLGLNGRLLTLTLDVDTKSIPAQQVRRDVQGLVQQIVPFVLADTPAQTPETRNCWIAQVLAAHQLLPVAERNEENLRFHETIAAHNLDAPRLVAEIAGFYESGKQPDRKLQLITDEIALLERKPTNLHEPERVKQLAFWSEQRHQLRSSLGIADETVKPWKSVRTLIDVHGSQSNSRSVNRPVVDGRSVYTLVGESEREAKRVAFTLHRFSLDADQHEVLGTLTLDNLASGDFGKSRLEDGDIDMYTTMERSTTEGSHFLRSACVAGQRYYAATMGKGMVAFPMAGGLVQTIDESSGLPSNFVQAVTCYEDTLYAWLGQPAKSAYLIRMKLDGSNIQVIASSRRTVQKTPLDNVYPVMCDFMTVDATRNRIVFRLTNDGSTDSLGLWALDLSTNELQQLKRTHLITGGLPPQQINGGQILIQDRGVLQVFDLSSNEYRPLTEPQSLVGDGRPSGQSVGDGLFAAYQPNTMMLPIALLNDDLWFGIPFGRLRLESKQFEHFVKLRDTPFFQPGVFAAQISAHELVLADPSAIWLLQLVWE